MMKKRIIILGILSSIWMTAGAQIAACFDKAGKKYGIDPLLLNAIALIESSMDEKAIHRNDDGSFDIGLMQVNSAHIPRLRRQGIKPERLFNDPCMSVMAGAEILAGFIKHYGYTWRAVGSYHTGNGTDRDPQRERYVTKVAREYRRLWIARQGKTVAQQNVAPRPAS